VEQHERAAANVVQKQEGNAAAHHSLLRQRLLEYYMERAEVFRQGQLVANACVVRVYVCVCLHGLRACACGTWVITGASNWWSNFLCIGVSP
jgi:hypothetical protein